MNFRDFYKLFLEDSSDETYLKLAENPEENKKVLQKMVDETARNGGYDVEGFHGSPNKGFTEFKNIYRTSGIAGRGFYFGTSPSMRSVLLRGEMQGGETRRFYLKNPDLVTEEDDGNTLVVRNPSQIKLADPVTYDSNGKVIPLSKRFNTQSDKITENIHLNILINNMTFEKLYFLITEGLDSRLPQLIKQFPQIPKETIPQIADADPTNNKKYLTWILKNYSSFRFPEDNNKIHTALTRFDILTRKSTWQGSKDINTFKSFPDLIKALENNTDITNQPVDTSTNQKKIKLKEHNDYILYKITDAETMMSVAKYTQWCVRDEPYASDYLKKGPFFYITYKQPDEMIHKDKKGNVVKSADEASYSYNVEGIEKPFVLIHFETGQIKDEYDEEISHQIAEEIYPMIQNSFKHFKFTYDEGIGDFNVFLNRKKNSGSSIAQGQDKEILEKFHGPHIAFQKLYGRSTNIIDTLQKHEHEYKQEIAKSSRLTLAYLTHINQLFTNNRDHFMEQKLLEHNSKEDIISFTKYLMNSIEPNNILAQLLQKIYYFTPSSYNFTSANYFLLKHGFDLEDFGKQLITNTKEFSDARRFMNDAVEKIKTPLTQYVQQNFWTK
jgi:hypothetical protein